MHPYITGALAAERHAQMLASAEISRLARQAGSGHRRTHIQAVPGRWTRRFTIWRTRTVPAAQLRLQQTRPAGRATRTAPAP